ncbi:MAG TPA: acetylglutamate kinase [Armatimonadota bacterium]|nr:acetylglutamate kinase [Armatimonadota bacterium]
MDELAVRARTLSEALPYIREFSGGTFVVKYGGSAMASASLSQAVMADVVLLRLVGVRVVLVHGGGPQVSDLMRRLGKEPTFVRGQRVTDAETMEIAEMVLAGKINKDIAAKIQMAGGQAVGLSGRDAGLIQARRRVMDSPEGPVDLGFVGQIESINAGLLSALTEDGFIPVVCSIAGGADGECYNINADHAAGRIAAALHAEKLLSLTDVRGLLRDRSDPASLIARLTVSEAEALVREGQVEGGMVPKLESCVDAVKAGTAKAHIVDGRIEHALLMEVFTDAGIGTMVVPDGP